MINFLLRWPTVVANPMIISKTGRGDLENPTKEFVA